MNSKTLQLNSKQIKTLQHQLSLYPMKTPQYTHFQAKLDKGTITAYTSGKVVFSGADALLYADQFSGRFEIQAGSDEVGTGDYFGPITVCAVYLDDESLIQKYQLLDSKTLTDDYILSVGEALCKSVVHSLLILDNATYNRVHRQKNLNAIKAELHQKAYHNLQLKLKHPLPKLTVIDQFAPAEKYYSYLKDDYGLQSFIFETKAESKYPAVAAASIIARYAFLISLQNLSQHYKMTFPKGAGNLVDEFGKLFVSKYSSEELKKVAKLHFSNTKRIL